MAIIIVLISLDPFLMHRVELKVIFLSSKSNTCCVPNAPCGVESYLS